MRHEIPLDLLQRVKKETDILAIQDPCIDYLGMARANALWNVA